MSDTEYWRLSATDLSTRTRAGDILAEAAVGAAVARMRAVNPGLNAVVVDLGEGALARARDLDRARAGGAAPGPLHGVPVTIKINVDQAGQATSNGLPALKDVIAPDDAPLVKRLQDAGAVVIGRTNTPEFSFRAETDNPLFGPTHNPWGRHVSPGGSSGGAGSAVMAGMGALAHGNDIGGSLRFPASANGAVTVKPGLSRVAAFNPGQTAERGMLAQNMSCQGMLARTARDLHLSMPVLIAPDPHDPWHVPLPWRGPALEGPIRVAWTDQVWGAALHPDVAAALADTRAALTDAGYLLEEIHAPAMPEAGELGYSALMSEVALLMGPDIERLGSDTLKAIFSEYYKFAPPLPMPDFLRAAARRTAFARDWSLLLDRCPLVLTPFLPQPFFTPGRDAEGAEGAQEALGSALWSYAMNFMNLPAGNLPARLAQLDRGPVPIGVQIVGRRWREDLVVDAMVAVEDRLGALAPQVWQHMG